MLIQATAARLPLADSSLHCVVTSPPYFNLRVYSGLAPQVWGGRTDCQHAWAIQIQKRGGGGEQAYDSYDGGTGHGQALMLPESATCNNCGAWRGHLGNEPTLEMYITHLIEIGRELWRVLRDDGIWFLNLGDSYANDRKWGGRSSGKNYTSAAGHYQGQRIRRRTGMRPKNKMLIPHRVALALQEAGWIVRQELAWLKLNPAPESVKDRPSTAHEYIFMLTKSGSVYWDAEAIKRPSTGQTGRANGFARDNGVKEWIAEIVPDQGYAQHRPDRQEDPDSSSSFRQYRTTDIWLDSLDLAIAETEAYLVHLERIRLCGGLLLDPESEPLAVLISLKGYPGAHYAVFPAALVMDLILGATSQAGVCPHCGAPWRRIVRTPDFSQQPKRKANKLEGQMISKGSQYLTSAGQAWQKWRAKNPNITLGFEPSCACPPHQPAPAIVADIFCGSGTIGEVCRKLGRRFIGLDLSAEYLARDAAARVEQKTTGAGLEEARAARRPRANKKIVRQLEAGQLKFPPFGAPEGV